MQREIARRLGLDRLALPDAGSYADVLHCRNSITPGLSSQPPSALEPSSPCTPSDILPISQDTMPVKLRQEDGLLMEIHDPSKGPV